MPAIDTMHWTDWLKFGAQLAVDFQIEQPGEMDIIIVPKQSIVGGSIVSAKQNGNRVIQDRIDLVAYNRERRPGSVNTVVYAGYSSLLNRMIIVEG